MAASRLLLLLPGPRERSFHHGRRFIVPLPAGVDRVNRRQTMCELSWQMACSGDNRGPPPSPSPFHQFIRRSLSRARSPLDHVGQTASRNLTLKSSADETWLDIDRNGTQVRSKEIRSSGW